MNAPAPSVRLLPLLAIAATACFPVLPTPPAVEPGLRTGIMTTYHHAEQRTFWIPDSTQRTSALRPQGTIYANYGVVPDEPGLPRLRVSHFGTTGWGMGWVAHVQAPPAWTGSWDVGVSGLREVVGRRTRGIVASAGRSRLERDRAWWVSGGVLSVASPFDGTRQRVGTFTISLDAMHADATSRVFIGGVVGPQDLRCGDTLSAKAPHTTALLCPWATRAFVGVALELRPMRGARRGPP